MQEQESIILFGGSGFVGTHLAHMLEERYKTIYIADIRTPRWHTKFTSEQNERVKYLYCDVRNPIVPEQFEGPIAAIVNLAAVHTSPGHPAHEYFEANILGAQNICDFARKKNVANVVFTSSISVYGPSEERKTEADIPMPAIPYGSSKIIAESIHRQWALEKKRTRRLTIIRPAVIFGAGEGGNFTRIANALQKGLFAYPGRTDTIKSCLYVKDICRFIIEQCEQNGASVSCFNFCYPEEISIKQIVKAFKSTLGYKCFEPVVPLWFVNACAFALNYIKIPFIQKMGLVPERIVKLVRSTNISSDALVKSGFTFRYSLQEALEDWAADCGSKTLF